MKKALNVCSIFLEAVVITMLFSVGSIGYRRTAMSFVNKDLNFYLTETFRDACGYTSWSSTPIFEILFWILVSTSLLFIALRIINLFKPIKLIENKKFLILPAFNTLLLFITTIIRTNFPEPYYSDYQRTNKIAWFSYSMKPVMYFIILIVLILLTIEIYSYFGNIEELKKVKIFRTKEQSNIDDIGKIKELYDAGAITQEEFEQKKKQLLGL